MRGTIQHAAGRVDELDVDHLVRVLGALKHHVLEEVRESAAPARLETKTDVVVHADRSDRGSAIGRDDDAKTVWQRGAFNGNLQTGH